MIISYIVLLPLWILVIKVFKFSLWVQLVLILLLILSGAVLRYLEKEGHLNRYTTFLYNFYPLQIFIYNLLRLEEFLRENAVLGFTALTLSFWLILHGWIHPGINLTCTLSFLLYFVGISYSRLRWNLLNDTYLNLYKGRDSFEWKDVILGMQTRVGNINNRLNNSVPFQYIPKRQASRAAVEKILENPEVQRVAIVGAVAVAAGAGAEVLVGAVFGFVRNILSSEEKQAVMAAKKELQRAEAQEAKALAKNHLLQNPVTDEGMEGKSALEKESALAIKSRIHAQEVYIQAQQKFSESLSNTSTSSSISNLMDQVHPF